MKVTLFFLISLMFMSLQGCSTDKALAECIEGEDCQVDLDVDTEKPESGSDDDNGNDDDDDDGDDPGQSECNTDDLGNFVSDRVVLGRLFKKTCEDDFIRLFVVKNNKEEQTLEYTKFQKVEIGSTDIVCPKLIKRYNIDGVLLERQDFDDTCNLED